MRQCYNDDRQIYRFPPLGSVVTPSWHYLVWYGYCCVEVYPQRHIPISPFSTLWLVSSTRQRNIHRKKKHRPTTGDRRTLTRKPTIPPTPTGLCRTLMRLHTHWGKKRILFLLEVIFIGSAYNCNAKRPHNWLAALDNRYYDHLLFRSDPIICMVKPQFSVQSLRAMWSFLPVLSWLTWRLCNMPPATRN